MFPWLRLLRVGCTLFGKRRIELLESTCIRVRVWPNDLDANLHVNNGRYLALADIGRLHWFVRTGALQMARQQKALPVVGDAIAKFRRDLKLFSKFEIHTRLIGWDKKWGFLEHRFVRNGRVLAVVAVRGVFKGKQGVVEPQIFLASLAPGLSSPPLPAWTQKFHDSMELLSEDLREAERTQGMRS